MPTSPITLSCGCVFEDVNEQGRRLNPDAIRGCDRCGAQYCRRHERAHECADV